MFNMGRALTAVLLSTLVSFTSYASSDDNRQMIQEITNNLLEEYDLTAPEVIFVPDVTQIEGSHPEAMAVTQCRRIRRTGIVSCKIYFDTCVLQLRERTIRNLAAHEAAHYINALINDDYTHGFRWARILRDQGWRVQRIYDENETFECE